MWVCFIYHYWIYWYFPRYQLYFHFIFLILYHYYTCVPYGLWGCGFTINCRLVMKMGKPKQHQWRRRCSWCFKFHKMILNRQPWCSVWKRGGAFESTALRTKRISGSFKCIRPGSGSQMLLGYRLPVPHFQFKESCDMCIFIDSYIIIFCFY